MHKINYSLYYFFCLAKKPDSSFHHHPSQQQTVIIIISPVRRSICSKSQQFSSSPINFMVYQYQYHACIVVHGLCSLDVIIVIVVMRGWDLILALYYSLVCCVGCCSTRLPHAEKFCGMCVSFPLISVIDRHIIIMLITIISDSAFIQRTNLW